MPKIDVEFDETADFTIRDVKKRIETDIARKLLQFGSRRHQHPAP